jgi:YD repeat-containing protein
VFEYGYDLAGRLWQVLRNGTLVARYIYDSNGNRIEVQGELGGATATYDDQDRLLTCGNASYTYTPMENSRPRPLLARRPNTHTTR